MTLKPLLVILNPAADRYRAQTRWQPFRAALDAAGIAYHVWQTERPKQAITLAQRAARASYQLVIAAGGDGTLNEVVNGLLTAELTPAELPVLGILPIGSANDLAGVLNIPQQTTDWMDLLRSGHVRPIDVGQVNGHYFINNTGIGFEAQVNVESRAVRHIHGPAVYLIAVFRALKSYTIPQVKIRLDDENEFDQDMLLISIGNGRKAGGSFWLTPKAEVDDSLLDYTIAQGLSRLGILRLLPKAINGRHIYEPAVKIGRCHRLDIHANIPLPAHTDGEVLTEGEKDFHILVHPQRLNVLAPAGPLQDILSPS